MKLAAGTSLFGTIVVFVDHADLVPLGHPAVADLRVDLTDAGEPVVLETAEPADTEEDAK